ncbi:MAG TPA: DUF2789 domain-containing protein [Holophagaceae bacterium]|nr:DUF2789 domain-containing protein [Holophagaceae bacterium]
MESHVHLMTELFVQLGLPSDPPAIQAFLAKHRPLPSHLPLAQAPFWNPAQAAFLREGLQEDGDWAGIIDKLDVGLRLD